MRTPGGDRVTFRRFDPDDLAVVAPEARSRAGVTDGTDELVEVGCDGRPRWADLLTSGTLRFGVSREEVIVGTWQVETERELHGFVERFDVCVRDALLHDAPPVVRSFCCT